MITGDGTLLLMESGKAVRWERKKKGVIGIINVLVSTDDGVETETALEGILF